MTTENQKQPLEWLTLQDVIATIRFSKAMVYRMIKESDFPAPIKIGVASRWPRHEVEAWMKKQQGEVSV